MKNYWLKRNVRNSVLMMSAVSALLLSGSLTGCKSASVPMLIQPSVKLQPLPPLAKQVGKEKMPSICLPTCLQGVKRTRPNLPQLQTKQGSVGYTASGSTKEPGAHATNLPHSPFGIEGRVVEGQ